jgi:hypothetical protein
VEAWLKVWREGVAPSIGLGGLRVLEKALDSDDQRLIQGRTIAPPPFQCCADWPVEGACLIGFVGWQGDGLSTVAEVEEFFVRVCYEADARLGDPAAIRWLLNWYDNAERNDMRRRLLPEVRRTIAEREAAAAVPVSCVG